MFRNNTNASHFEQMPHNVNQNSGYNYNLQAQGGLQGNAHAYNQQFTQPNCQNLRTNHGPRTAQWPPQQQFNFEVDQDFLADNATNPQFANNSKSFNANINSIQVGVSSLPLVGFVLAKEDTRNFEPKEGSDSGPRSVLSFTLRDSPFDYVNVSLWGKPSSVGETAASFSVGDIVQISGFNVKDKQENDDRYRPWTPSPYQIVLNESHGSICQYEGTMIDDFTRLAHMPLQTPGPVYTLSEITNNIRNLSNDLVSFTAAVRMVGAARSVVAKSSGRKMHLREIKLFDQHVPLFHLILWSNEMIQFSEHWQTNETVLNVVDVKVSYDQFKKGVVASASSKSIFILNPDTRQGAALYQFAQTVTWPDDDECKPQVLQTIDLSTVRAEYSIHDFVRMCDQLQPDKSEHAIIYGFLSAFDLDGSLDHVVSAKCCECGKILPSVVSGRCSNYDCMRCDISDLSESGDIFYNMRADISDYTATLSNCKLSSETLINMLQYKAPEFVQLADEDRTKLKWTYLFERCRFIVKAYRLGDFPVNFVLLDTAKLSCQEHIKHMT